MENKGMYLLYVESDKGNSIQKIIIKPDKDFELEEQD